MNCTTAEYGIFPNSEEDMNHKFLDMFSLVSDESEVSLEKGDYYFSASKAQKRDLKLSNTDRLPIRKCAVIIENKKNLTIDFNDSNLFYAGQVQPISVLNCENITIKNAVIDWKKPLIAEGIVKATGDDYMDIMIDSELYPHEHKNNTIYFDVGDGESYEFCDNCMIYYDPLTNTITADTGDCLTPASSKVTRLDKDLYRFTCRHGEKKPYVGSIVVLQHNHRMHAGIFFEGCKNIKLENITIYNCGGLGILCQFCENIALRKINFVPNLAAGRKIINGHDDGMHLTSNRGLIEISECSFIGLMDDPINVHGCYAKGNKVINGNTLVCEYMHDDSMAFRDWAKNGDVMTFIDRKTMSPIFNSVVESYKPDEYKTFTISFKEDITVKLGGRDIAGIALENITNTCDFHCHDNLFASCRARGILVSTPGKAVIENNVFESSGSAILVAGDANYWYESGACHDLTIRNNTFTDCCLSSMYQGCEGVISVCPEIPSPDINKPFHHNIKITDNVFYTPENPVLYAIGAENLTFSHNRIIKSYRSKPWHPRKKLYFTEYCTNVAIDDNLIIGKLEIAENI